MADQAHEWTDEQLEQLQRRLDQTYEQAAREMREKLDQYLAEFDRQNREWKSEVAAGNVTREQYKAWLKAQSMRRQYLTDMSDMLARDAANTNRIAADIINNALPRIYAENANFAAYSIESGIGMDTHAFSLYDQDTIRRIMLMDEDDQIMHEVIPYGPVPPDKALLQSVRVNPKTVKDVAWNRQHFTSSIAQSILQGESIPNAAKRLMTVLNMDRNMATRAARTAITSAENAGRIDSYRRAKDMGIELEQEWLATPDERTRETHRLLDGQHVAVGKSFCPHGYGNEYSIRFPADPTARGDMTWNCRCTLVAWFPEDGQESLDNRWSRLPKGMTYEEWKDGKEAEKERKEASGVVDGKDVTTTWKPNKSESEFDIRDIIHHQGFDGTPRVVAADEFSRLAAEATDSGLIMQRAYGAPTREVLDAYREALYGGDFYVDCSGGHMYGRGMYASFADGVEPSEAMQRQSERYARSHGAKVGYVETMTLDKSARVITYDELMQQWENEDIPKWLREGDDGVLAAALGYDAIRVNDAGEMVILNRTKLIIRRPE